MIKKIKKYKLAAVTILSALILGLIFHTSILGVGNRIVEIEVKVARNDVFQLFYKNGSQTFTESNSIKVEIKGSNEFQFIKFQIPNNTSISQLRVDFGNNKNQQSISINKIAFKHSIYGDLFTIGKNFKEEITPNEFVAINKNRLLLKEINNNYDPYIIVDNNWISYLRFYLLWLGLIMLIVVIAFTSIRLNNRVLNKRTVLNGLTGIIFFAIILLPSLDQIFEISKRENIENRNLADAPEFSISNNFVTEFENYYNDNYGFRQLLIHYGSLGKLMFFKSSSNVEKAVIGKEGWMYYNHPVLYHSYTNQNLLSQIDLDNKVNVWEARKEQLGNQGIKYILGFWPNKQTIYPEYFSETMKLQVKDTLSKADQVLEYLKKTNSPVQLIDVRNALFEAKERQHLYQTYDSHWNLFGSYTTYFAFFKQLLPELEIEPYDRSHFDILSRTFYGGDLTKILGIQKQEYYTDIRPVFDFKPGNVFTQEGQSNKTVKTFNKNCNNNLRVLIFRDSYANGLVQFFSLHYKEIIYIKGRYNEEAVLRLAPDIVMDLHVERGL